MVSLVWWSSRWLRETGPFRDWQSVFFWELLLPPPPTCSHTIVIIVSNSTLVQVGWLNVWGSRLGASPCRDSPSLEGFPGFCVYPGIRDFLFFYRPFITWVFFFRGSQVRSLEIESFNTVCSRICIILPECIEGPFPARFSLGLVPSKTSCLLVIPFVYCSRLD